MSEPTKTTRRDFLTGKSAVEALGDAVVGPAQPLPPPEATQSGRTYLLQVSREAMACEFEVLLNAGQYPAGPDAAMAALDMVEHLEAQLTVFRDTSEIAAINRRAAAGPIAIEPRLFDLLARAVDLFDATGGAFDITAGPLSKVWGFYRRQGRMPDAGEVAEALALVGSDKLALDLGARTIAFRQAGMELNFGAIGKGYALDRAAEVLQAAGVEDFCLHGGNSSVLARGFRISDLGFQISDSGATSTNPKSKILNPKSEILRGWTIALRHPLKPDVRLAEFVLRNHALGTSGSGTQFFHCQGKRYGHILDPRTGWPAHKVLSATVIAPTAEQADALSTALFVMGLDAAREFCASRPEIGALFVVPGSRAGTIELRPLNLTDDAWRAL
jgi:thiamine biosynthesis lipoprotein